MRHLRQLGNQFSIPIPPDEKGYIGRECPECERYFKITLGTGLTGDDLPCYCPYCGHSAPQDQFFTQSQIEYAKSVVINKVTGAFIKDLKTLEFNHRPRGAFGIGISMKVEGCPQPVRHYSELELEEEVVCEQLLFALHGVRHVRLLPGLWAAQLAANSGKEPRRRTEANRPRRHGRWRSVGPACR